MPEVKRDRNVSISKSIGSTKIQNLLRISLKIGVKLPWGMTGRSISSPSTKSSSIKRWPPHKVKMLRWEPQKLGLSRQFFLFFRWNFHAFFCPSLGDFCSGRYFVGDLVLFFSLFLCCLLCSGCVRYFGSICSSLRGTRCIVCFVLVRSFCRAVFRSFFFLLLFRSVLSYFRGLCRSVILLFH